MNPQIESPVVLFEDPNVIVLDKPAGLLSQGEETGSPNVVDWLRERLGRPYVGLIHRLDRNTSGVMIVAKRTKAAQRLTQALQDGRILRSYLGWVEGKLADPVRWKHWLLKDEARNIVRVVAPGTPGAREAILSAKPLRQNRSGAKTMTLVEFVLETGRSHQIRAQCAYEKLPLAGDTKYGGSGFWRPALHSHRLEYPHPISGELMRAEAPLPKDMETLGD